MIKEKNIELVVFDMAGTTVDEDNVVYKTVRDSINEYGHAFTLDQVLEVGAGKEKSQAIRDVLQMSGASPEEAIVREIFSRFRQRLDKAYENLAVKEQPGATACIHKLRSHGIKVVLNTGYDRKTAESLIDRIGWKLGHDIDGLVTASDVNVGRPGPEMIESAMKLTSIHDKSCVAKVGDSKIDIEEGKNACCGLTVGITTGAQTRSQLSEAEPTVIVDSLEEFSSLILT